MTLLCFPRGLKCFTPYDFFVFSMRFKGLYSLWFFNIFRVWSSDNKALHKMALTDITWGDLREPDSPNVNSTLLDGMSRSMSVGV